MFLLQAVVVLGDLFELAGKQVKILDEFLTFFLQQFLLLLEGSNFILDNHVINPSLLFHLAFKINLEFDLEVINIPKLFLSFFPGPQ